MKKILNCYTIGNSTNCEMGEVTVNYYDLNQDINDTTTDIEVVKVVLKTSDISGISKAKMIRVLVVALIQTVQRMRLTINLLAHITLLI